MFPQTTIVDVIEDTLGQELGPDCRPSLERLSDTDLKKLGRALYEFSDAEWMELPSFSYDEPCFALHPDSLMTGWLGGVGFGTKKTVPFSPEQMTGSAMLALTYLPRVAVNDGIQYFLDYYDCMWAPTPERRKTILNIMQFYGSCRQLVRSGELVIVPRSKWLNIRDRDAAPRGVDDRVARALANLHSARAREDSVTGEQSRPGDARVQHNDRRSGHQRYWATAVIGANDTVALLSFCSETGYGPLLDTPVRQLSFDALSAAAVWNGAPPRAAPPIQRSHVLLPVIGKLTPAEFINARRDDAFVEFRRTIDEIGRLSQQSLGPLDLKEVVGECLQRGRERVQKSISQSSVLSDALTEARDMAVGALVSGVVAGALNPDWADDPWKLLVTGGIAGLLKLSHSVAKHAHERSRSRKVNALFVSLAENVNLID